PGSARNRSGYVHRVAYLAAAIRDMDASGPEGLRSAYDSGGGIFPRKEWRVFDMNRFKSGKRFAALLFSFILLITILIRLPAVAVEENQTAPAVAAPDFELQDLKG